MRYAAIVPRSQLMVIIALALGCGIAAGVFVYFVASAPEVEARPAPVQPVHVANPSPPSVVTLPTQPIEPAIDETVGTTGTMETMEGMVTQVAALSTKMKPEDEPDMQSQMTEPQGPRSAASLEQRVHHARRQCHEMAERLCRCYPQTCSQQRQAHRDADRGVVQAARNLQHMPDALNQMLRQLEQSCRESYAAVRRSMPQCF